MQFIFKRILILSLALLPFHLPLTALIHSRTGFNQSGLVLQLAALIIFVLYILSNSDIRASFVSLRKRSRLFVSLALFVVSILFGAIIAALNGLNMLAVLSGGYHYALPLVTFVGVYMLTVGGHLRRAEFVGVLKIFTFTYGLVVVFALMQYFLLPKDILNIFGYDQVGIRAYQYVGNNLNDIRVLSTTAGPNQLGIYAAFMVPVLLYGYQFFKGMWRRLTVVLILLSPAVIFVSKSRTGMVAFVLGAITYAWFAKDAIKQKIMPLGKSKRLLLGIAVAGMIVVLGSVVYQGTISRITGSLSGSDSQRLESFERAWESFREKPFGHGLGSAGIGSYYNPSGPTIIENYHLQILYELGFIGFIFWCTLLFFLARALFKQSQASSQSVGLSLLLIILASNLFLPALADILLATIPWIMFGFINGSSKQSSHITKTLRRKTE